MGFLATIKSAAQRVARFVPVDSDEFGGRPDHKFYIRASDFSPCCDWHAERAFRATGELTEQPKHMHSSGRMRHYIG
jgi:hypothetical protein